MTAPAAAAPLRGWRVVIPAPCDWISTNRLGGHWRGRHELATQWRTTAWTIFHGHRLPTRLQRVRVDVELHFRDLRPRDAANYEPTVKPVVDALGPPFVRPPDRRSRRGKAAPGVGLLPDDTPAHLDGPHITIGRLWRDVCRDRPVRPVGLMRPGGMTVTITDMSTEAPA